MNTCRICGRERPPGYKSTCGRSLCQEADYFDTTARAARKGSKNRELLTKEAQEKAEQAARFARTQEARHGT